MKKLLAVTFLSNYAFLDAKIETHTPKEGLDIFTVEIVKATPESLKGYGDIVYPQEFDSYKVTIATWPQLGRRPVEEDTGNEGGVTEGSFCMKWEGNELYASNHAVSGQYLTGWSVYPTQAKKHPVVLQKNRKYVLTYRANYHPDGGQLVVPKKKRPFVALLALPGDDVTPKDFKAFYFDGAFGVHISPGVWRQPFFPLDDELEFFDKQRKVHACIAIDFASEFKCYLAVPLFEPTN